MLLPRRAFDKNNEISRTSFLSCCPCVFRGRKLNSVEPETWGTPVLAVTFVTGNKDM